MRNAEQMIQMMSAEGLRITEQRRVIARLFANAPGFMTPKDIYFGLEAEHPGVSYETVYRNLRIMHEMGILEQFHFEDGMRFRIGCMNHRHHHHHLICLDCQQIFPIDFCPMDYFNLSDSFQIERHHFEVYGYCADCKKRETKESAETRTA